MTVTANFHNPKTAEARRLSAESPNHALYFDGDDGCYVTLFVPPHVAEATAAAFNRAMQAVPRGTGYTYQGRDLWLISNEYGWRAQSDEVTGDGDPPHYFAEAKSLMALLDEIDATEAESAAEEAA